MDNEPEVYTSTPWLFDTPRTPGERLTVLGFMGALIILPSMLMLAAYQQVGWSITYWQLPDEGTVETALATLAITWVTDLIVTGMQCIMHRYSANTTSGFMALNVLLVSTATGLVLAFMTSAEYAVLYSYATCVYGFTFYKLGGSIGEFKISFALTALLRIVIDYLFIIGSVYWWCLHH